MRTLSRDALLAFLRFYRAGISPILPPSCRFEPTCSEYARTAIERFGAARGSWMAARRLARCHPFGGQGWDPVPERGDEPTEADSIRHDRHERR